MHIIEKTFNEFQKILLDMQKFRAMDLNCKTIKAKAKRYANKIVKMDKAGKFNELSEDPKEYYRLHKMSETMRSTAYCYAS
jgi:hypothetical protein